jgi:hypothetical protein
LRCSCHSAINDDHTVAVEGVSNDEENLENLNVENVVEIDKNTTIKKNTHEDPADEFCFDQTYLDSLVDEDIPVNEILVEAACPQDLDEEAFEELLDYNTKISGINMVTAKTKKSESGLISSEVTIQPSPKQAIKSLHSFNRSWNLKILR